MKIEFPPVFVLTSVFSCICAAIKLVFGADEGWIQTLVVIPLLLYFMYCAGFILLGILSLKCKKIYENKKTSSFH